jgi:hypothetical protein
MSYILRLLLLCMNYIIKSFMILIVFLFQLTNEDPSKQLIDYLIKSGEKNKARFHSKCSFALLG